MGHFTDALSPVDKDRLASERFDFEHGADAQEEPRERFVPTTDAAFEWALLKRARALAKVNEIEERKAVEVGLLAREFDKLAASEKADADFFEDMIRRGMEAKEPDDKGKRTVKTVAGTVYVRTSEHIEWTPDVELVAWCKANAPEAVIVFEKPDKKALKERIHTTGELPDGVTVEERETVVLPSE
jgi:hypothetical protein